MPLDDTCAICQRTKSNGLGRFFNLPDRGSGRRRRWDAVFADLGIGIREVSVRRNFGVCWRHFLEGRPSRDPANPDFAPCIRLWGDDDSGFLSLGRLPSSATAGVANTVGNVAGGEMHSVETEVLIDDDSELEPSTKRRHDYLFGHQLLPQKAFMDAPFTEIVDVPVASECVEVVTSLEAPKTKKLQTADFNKRRAPDEDQLTDQLYAETDLIYSNDPILTASAEPQPKNSTLRHSFGPTYSADPQQSTQQNLRIKWVRMKSGVPIHLTAAAPSGSFSPISLRRTSVVDKRLRRPPPVDKRIVDQMSTNDNAFREAARVIQEVADVRKRDASFAEAYRVIQDIESNRFSDNRKFKQKQRSETRGCVSAPCQSCRMTYYWPPQTMRQRLVWVRETADGGEQRFDGRVDGAQPYFRCPVCDIESPTILDPATEHLFC